jgi:hypothetical protein
MAAEPTSSTFAGSVVAALYTAATVLGVPVSVALLAALGAAFALSQAEKTPLNLTGAFSVVISVLISWVLGLFGGPLFGGLVIGPILKAVGSALTGTSGDPLAALVIAMYGQKQILPKVITWVGSVASTRLGGGNQP